MKKWHFWRYIWQLMKNAIQDACLNEYGFQLVGLLLPRSTFAVTFLLGFSILELHNIGHVQGGYLIVARPRANEDETRDYWKHNLRHYGFG